MSIFSATVGYFDGVPLFDYLFQGEIPYDPSELWSLPLYHNGTVGLEMQFGGEGRVMEGVKGFLVNLTGVTGKSFAISVPRGSVGDSFSLLRLFLRKPNWSNRALFGSNVPRSSVIPEMIEEEDFGGLGLGGLIGIIVGVLILLILLVLVLVLILIFFFLRRRPAQSEKNQTASSGGSFELGAGTRSPSHSSSMLDTLPALSGNYSQMPREPSSQYDVIKIKEDGSRGSVADPSSYTMIPSATDGNRSSGDIGQSSSSSSAPYVPIPDSIAGAPGVGYSNLGEIRTREE